MGFASYLEDIADRLTDDLAQLKAAVADGPLGRDSRIDAVRGWIAEAERLLRGLREHLDVATDPTMDMARRVVELERENVALKAELAGTRRSLESQLDTCASLKEELRDADKRARKAVKQLEKFKSTNPDALYDKYSSADRTRRLGQKD